MTARKATEICCKKKTLNVKFENFEGFKLKIKQNFKPRWRKQTFQDDLGTIGSE